jgi:adenine phosphoribosyltransferase
MDILSKIRNIPDFPKPGIQFKDITTLLQDGPAFRHVIDLLEKRYRDKGLTHVVGIESRGFVFAAALADRLGIGMVPVRKQGKLPGDKIRRTYTLEYGSATIEVHRDALKKGDKVVVLDDLLATGGTMKAACELVHELGAEIHEIWVLIELGFLDGRKTLTDCSLHSEVVVSGE